MAFVNADSCLSLIGCLSEKLLQSEMQHYGNFVDLVRVEWSLTCVHVLLSNVFWVQLFCHCCNGPVQQTICLTRIGLLTWTRDSWLMFVNHSLGDQQTSVLECTNSKEACSREQQTVIKTQHPCKTMAAHFNPRKTPQRHFVIAGATRAIVTCLSHPKWTTSLQLARWFFMQKHHSPQQREDCVEGSWAEPLSNITFSLVLFWACDFNLQTTQKACGFWRSAPEASILTLMIQPKCCSLPVHCWRSVVDFLMELSAKRTRSAICSKDVQKTSTVILSQKVEMKVWLDLTKARRVEPTRCRNLWDEPSLPFHVNWQKDMLPHQFLWWQRRHRQLTNKTFAVLEMQSQHWNSASWGTKDICSLHKCWCLQLWSLQLFCWKFLK